MINFDLGEQCELHSDGKILCIASNFNWLDNDQRQLGSSKAMNPNEYELSMDTSKPMQIGLGDDDVCKLINSNKDELIIVPLRVLGDTGIIAIVDKQ